jgi:hypothetical protein
MIKGCGFTRVSGAAASCQLLARGEALTLQFNGGDPCRPSNFRSQSWSRHLPLNPAPTANRRKPLLDAKSFWSRMQIGRPCRRPGFTHFLQGRVPFQNFSAIFPRFVMQPFTCFVITSPQKSTRISGRGQIETHHQAGS